MADVDDGCCDDFEDDFSLDDDLLALEISKSPFKKSKSTLKPSISDQCNVGYFSLDHATQTDVTEIVEINKLIEYANDLLQDASRMKRDVNFIRCTMQAMFEKKLKDKSIELYVRVNEKIATLEKTHLEKIGVIRRAFRQQLCDAVVQVHAYYNGDYLTKMDNQREKESKAQKRVAELENIIRTRDATIKTLTEQTEQLDHVEVMSYGSETDRETQRLEFENQISELEKKITRLDCDLEVTQQENTELRHELEAVRKETEFHKLERDKIKQDNDKLKKSKEELMATFEKDKSNSLKMLESQKLSLEKEKEDRLSRSKKEQQSLEEVNRQRDLDLAMEAQRYEQLVQEKKLYEDALMKEREKVRAKEAELRLYENAEKNAAFLSREVTRLQNELKMVQRSWEKKFSILQQSMHALKDESFLRQSLHRQSALLHQAPVSYAQYETPATPKAGFPSRPPSQPGSNKKRLPAIVRSQSSTRETNAARTPGPDTCTDVTTGADMSSAITPGPETCIDVTTGVDIYSAIMPGPDKRSQLTSADENQILSDEEDIPPDVILLPSPPPVR